MKTIALIFLLAVTNAHALSPTQLNNKIAALHACANSLSDSYFFIGHGLDSRLMQWRARGRSYTERLDSVAVSTFVRDINGDGYLTITPSHVLFTPANLTVDLIDPDSSKDQVTLNLQNKRNTKYNLPVVDERDSLSSAWYNDITIFRAHTDGFMYMRGFWELKESHTEINPKDILYEGLAEAAVNQWSFILGKLVVTPASRIQQLHGTRSYIPKGELEYVRLGLCHCERVFPKEVEAERDKMLDPTYPISVGKEGNPIKSSDLLCENKSS